MRKTFLSGLCLALLCGFTSDAIAGEVVTREDGAKCITISGEIELDTVSRSSFFGDLHRFRGGSINHPYGADLDLASGFTNPLIAFDLFDGRNSNSEFFIDPEITLNFDIELVDNVRGFIQLENAQRDRYPVIPFGPLGFDAKGGLNQGFPYLGGGRITQRAGDDNMVLNVEQAYVEFDSLIECLRIRSGISDLEVDLRGDGNAFFLDIAESEGIGPEITVPGIIGNFQPVQSLEFGGITATYTMAELMGGTLYTDVFLGTLLETGFQNQDQYLTGIDFRWMMPTEDDDINQTISFMTTWFNTDSSNWITSHVLGVDWNLVNVGGTGGNLELFWEMAVQYGQFTSAKVLEAFYPQRVLEDHPDGLAPPTNRSTSSTGSDILTQPAGASRSNDYIRPYSNDQEQKAWATYFGFKYTQANMDYRPWVEVLYLYTTGDDGGWAGDPGKIEHANENFVSFEDNDATLVVEENDYGLDIDSNYWKIQVAGGVSLSPLFNNEADVSVKLLYAYFQANDTPWSVRDQIGHEVDLIFNWNYSQDLSFMLGFGFLWGSEFFEDLDDYAYLIHHGPLVDIEDHASIINLSTTLRF